MISFKTNLIAGYVAQVYAVLAGIVTLPLYLRYMGREAFGLVAIFITLQGLLLLLDMGLSPTLGREMARFRAGAIAGRDVRRLFHLLETLFASVAIVVAAAFVSSASFLAAHWLRPEHLPADAVATSLDLMGLTLAVRLVSGLYRGAVGGFEHIVWLSGFGAAIATARYAMVIPWLLFVGSSPTNFFAFQLVVAVVEATMLGLKCRSLVKGEATTTLATQPYHLKAVLLFSFSASVGASLWSALSQIDKLILSNILSLGDYGIFNLAAIVASGVGLAAGPITLALSPRLAHLHAAGQSAEMIVLYRRSTQLMVVIAASTATMLVCFAWAVLWAWTGRADVADRAETTLALYAAGNAISALFTMVFFLQFAMGDLRLHVRGLVLMLAILLSTLAWAAPRYGMAGAGGAWLSANLFCLLVWTARIHHRIAPGLHGDWLVKDVAKIAIPTLAFGIAARMVTPMPVGRPALAAELGVLGFCLLVVAIASSSVAREWLLVQFDTQIRPRSNVET